MKINKHLLLLQHQLSILMILSTKKIWVNLECNFKINPNYRLILMIALLVLFITSFSINLGTIDFVFLNHWMKNNIFSIIFLTLCFLFIINGANLIDGFNGLLTIHLLIINLILLFLNLKCQNLIGLQ